MSHATVLVKITKKRLAESVGDVNAAVERMMAPYYEELSVEPYRKDEDPSVVLIMHKYNPAPLVEGHDPEFEPEHVGRIADIDGVEHFVIDEKITIKLADLEQYLAAHGESWCGRPMYVDAQGIFYMSDRNPDSKWDWWVIGGRWRGLLRTKPGVPQRLGERRWLDRSGENHDPTLSDIAKVGDLDFERMQLDADRRLREDWEKFLVIRDVVNKDHDQLSTDERELVQPFGFLSTLMDMGAITRERAGEDEQGRPVWGAFVAAEYADFEAFKAKHGGVGELHTWAVLDDDGWHEKGQLGWFGSHAGSAEQLNEFQNEYMERFILHEDPETTLVVVDYHI